MMPSSVDPIVINIAHQPSTLQADGQKSKFLSGILDFFFDDFGGIFVRARRTTGSQ